MSIRKLPTWMAGDVGGSGKIRYVSSKTFFFNSVSKENMIRPFDPCNPAQIFISCTFLLTF